MSWIDRAAALVRGRSWPVGQEETRRRGGFYGVPLTDWRQDDPASYVTSSNGVYSCVRMRSQALAALPIVHYDEAGEMVERSPVVELLQYVNPHWSWNRLAAQIESSLCLWGEAFLYVDRGQSGTAPPQELWWLRPDRVRPVIHAEEYIAGFLYDDGTASPRPFSTDEIVWLRYANPADEFSGLAPLTAASLAADVSTSAMKSNRAIFVSGNVPAALVMPEAQRDGMYTRFNDDQLTSLQRFFTKRLTGVDNRHRVAIASDRFEVTPLGWSPKDAEFAATLGLTLEEIARAFGVPLFLLGVREGTTYANLAEAKSGFWSLTMAPEADYIGAELTEQLLPMFGMGGTVELSVAEVPELQDDKATAWAMVADQIAKGAVLVNEWREAEGLPPVAWGDEPPVSSGFIEAAPPPAETPAEEPPALPEPAAEGQASRLFARLLEDDDEPDTRGLEYGGEEHVALMRAFDDDIEPHERAFLALVTELMEEQADELVKRLKQLDRRAYRDGRAIGASDLAALFQVGRWRRIFEERAAGILPAIMDAALIDQIPGMTEEIAGELLSSPTFERVIEARAQAFAERVNDETWSLLRVSLIEGIDGGEPIGPLADRVREVMGDRIRSSGETIARTEVVGAYNGSSYLGAREMGLETKTWLAALDDRTRDSHRDLHRVTIPIDEDFANGGPAPGSIGKAEEDINCRCRLVYGRPLN